MKSNYKRLGDYIQELKVRNTEQKAEQLLGINIDKFFMPSVANVVGTDLSVYKLVRKNQFVCNRMHVGRDYRLPISMSKSDEEFMVSPAYDVFEVMDTEALNPEFLMMWFSRKEFDRNAWFYTDADVRGGLPWKSFCDMQLPIPHITKQREIVKEYSTIQNRINLNNQLIQKLEETALAIYKQWFVEFEFPDENGKPYKSNGGKMIECGIVEIPKNWEQKEIASICDITSSKRIFESEYQESGIPFYRGKEITQKKAGDIITDLIYISIERYNELIKNYGKPSKGDILMTAVGTIGSTYMVEDEQFYFKDGNVIWFKNFKQKGSNYFLYDFMQTEQFSNLIKEITIGSTQSAITIKTFGQQKLVFPEKKVLDKYLNLSSVLNDNLIFKKNENQKLSELKDLLLSKLATVEN
mgnify:CR=1 FL=1